MEVIGCSDRSEELTVHLHLPALTFLSVDHSGVNM